MIPVRLETFTNEFVGFVRLTDAESGPVESTSPTSTPRAPASATLK